MSVQGKFVGCLSLIFILNTVHHGKTACLLFGCSESTLRVASCLDLGMDLTLQFDWEKILNGTTPSV